MMRLSELLGARTICVCGKRVTVSAPPATAEKHAQLARSIFTDTSRPLRTLFDMEASKSAGLRLAGAPQFSTILAHINRSALSLAIV